MSRYAERTDVSIDRSRAEIEHTLERFGATEFVSGWDKSSNIAVIGFKAGKWRMRFRMEMPDRNDPRFVYKKINQSAYRERRTPAQAHQAYEQAARERWRALAVLIKAKLAAIEAGISTIQDEFLANAVLPDNRTAGEWLKPEIDSRAYQTGQMPPLLPGVAPALPAPQDDTDEDDEGAAV